MQKLLNLDNKTIVFTGGGTGGHLWPIVTVARWCRQTLESRNIYFGGNSHLERRIWKKEKLRHIYIPSGKKSAFWDWRIIIAPFMIFFGIIKAGFWLLAIKPAMIFSKGGYSALPVIIAAKILHIPVIGHESDIVMGESNLQVLKWGGIVLTAFPNDLYNLPVLLNDRTRYTGMVINPGFYDNNFISQARNNLDKIDILIFGGSQGAERINKKVAAIWHKLSALGNVLHITGVNNYALYINLWHKLPEEIRKNIHLKPEIDNLPQIINEAKIIICRAGATSLWEVISASKKVITIPLPESKNDHQRLNALWLAQEFHGVKIIEEKYLTSVVLSSEVEKMLKTNINPNITHTMVMPKDAITNVGQVIYEQLSEVYFRNKRRIHLIGSQGVSMQGIKWICEKRGNIVTGSDLSSGGHKKSNISKKLDAVVYSSATAMPGAPGKIEIDEARRLNIPTFKRSEFIILLAGAKKIIAVSGTHGKTTTASMITHILKKNNLDPSYLIGVPVSENRMGPAGWGRNNLFVLEACEYDRSFNDFTADYAIINNIEKEHLDYFTGGIKEIQKAFAEFLQKSRPGSVVVFGDDTENCHIVEKYIRKDRPDIKIIYANQKIRNYDKYRFFGKHNAINASVAVTISSQIGIDYDTAQESLLDFEGAKRRLEYIGEYQDNVVYDDYGHHPTEITASIKAIQEKYPNKKIWLIFQPHQTSRTEDFFDDFVTALSQADKVYITDIYQVAGREEKSKVDSEMLAEKINKKNKNKATYIGLPYEDVTEQIKKSEPQDVVIITMGATNIYEVAKDIVGEY